MVACWMSYSNTKKEVNTNMGTNPKRNAYYKTYVISGLPTYNKLTLYNNACSEKSYKQVQKTFCEKMGKSPPPTS